MEGKNHVSGPELPSNGATKYKESAIQLGIFSSLTVFCTKSNLVGMSWESPLDR